mmetsp:Transcript_4428/g.13437  ORF Transcript_4428/g.13437 Transcript_4428/m.13437 type:complete len:131 (+) Transcript_4428:70-462(+)
MDVEDASAKMMDVDAFTERYLEDIVRFQVVWMERAAWVWVGAGGAAGALGSMAAAVPPTLKAMAGDAAATKLLGGSSFEFSKRIAAKLSKRFEMMIYASCSLPANSMFMEGFIERKLIQVFIKRTSKQAT